MSVLACEDVSISLRLDGLTLFGSMHSPFTCVVQSRLIGSSALGSSIRVCMRCGIALVAETIIVCIGRETAFDDRLVIYI